MKNLFVEVRLNGVGNAFLRELACDPECPQCSSSKIRSSTSASLLIKTSDENENQILDHVLFDCGPGTTDSLIDYGITNINYLFNTHNHLDHIGDIDRIVNSLSRHQAKFDKLPVYASKGTWKKGIVRSFPWLLNKIEWIKISDRMMNNSIPLNLTKEIKITPFPVYHGPFAYQPAIYLIEFDSYKIIFCWDILYLTSKFPNFNISFKKNPEPEKDEDLSNIYNKLSKATDLFLAGNTVTPKPITGHMSIIDGFELIKKINPKKTWIVHYSGHEDEDGPLSDEDLQEWINRNKANYGLENHIIQLANHGEIIKYVQ